MSTTPSVLSNVKISFLIDSSKKKLHAAKLTNGFNVRLVVDVVAFAEVSGNLFEQKRKEPRCMD